VEGNRLAVRHARWLLERDGTRVYAINRTGRPLYCAGLDFTTSLFKPLVAATMETLENAGMSQHQAAAIAEQLFQRSLRQFLKAGKRGWEGPLASGETDVIEERVRALYEANPALADYYCDQALEALRFFSTRSGMDGRIAPEPGAGQSNLTGGDCRSQANSSSARSISATLHAWAGVPPAW